MAAGCWRDGSAPSDVFSRPWNMGYMRLSDLTTRNQTLWRSAFPSGLLAGGALCCRLGARWRLTTSPVTPRILQPARRTLPGFITIQEFPSSVIDCCSCLPPRSRFPYPFPMYPSIHRQPPAAPPANLRPPNSVTQPTTQNPQPSHSYAFYCSSTHGSPAAHGGTRPPCGGTGPGAPASALRDPTPWQRISCRCRCSTAS
jgi:hypothetical protein